MLPSGILPLLPGRPGSNRCYYSARAGTAVYAPCPLKTPRNKGFARGFAVTGIL